MLVDMHAADEEAEPAESDAATDGRTLTPRCLFPRRLLIVNCLTLSFNHAIARARYCVILTVNLCLASSTRLCCDELCCNI